MWSMYRGYLHGTLASHHIFENLLRTLSERIILPFHGYLETKILYVHLLTIVK